MTNASKHTTAVPPYMPTVLLAGLTRPGLLPVVEALFEDGWDIRMIPEGDIAASPRPAHRGGRQTPRAIGPAATESALTCEEIISAARAIQPDVIVVSGDTEDPWAFGAVRELRFDPATSELGLVVFPNVSVPDDLDITPMSGPDAWVFLDARPAQAVATIRRTVNAAMENRLEWAQRDWTAEDRRHNAIRALKLHVENGRLVEPELLAEALYGPHVSVDIQTWEDDSSHMPGWRFGGEPRYQRPLLVRYQELNVDEHEIGEQRFILYSRSSLLTLAAAHVLAELAGGWPSIEVRT